MSFLVVGISVEGLALCCGSRYFNLDDCWAKSRKEDGTLVADQARKWG